jgi:hypothetical protein
VRDATPVTPRHMVWTESVSRIELVVALLARWVGCDGNEPVVRVVGTACAVADLIVVVRESVTRVALVPAASRATEDRSATVGAPGPIGFEPNAANLATEGGRRRVNFIVSAVPVVTGLVSNVSEGGSRRAWPRACTFNMRLGGGCGGYTGQVSGLRPVLPPVFNRREICCGRPGILDTRRRDDAGKVEAVQWGPERHAVSESECGAADQGKCRPAVPGTAGDP